MNQFYLRGRGKIDTRIVDCRKYIRKGKEGNGNVCVAKEKRKGDCVYQVNSDVM